MDQGLELVVFYSVLPCGCKPPGGFAWALLGRRLSRFRAYRRPWDDFWDSLNALTQLLTLPEVLYPLTHHSTTRLGPGSSSGPCS